VDGGNRQAHAGQSSINIAVWSSIAGTYEALIGIFNQRCSNWIARLRARQSSMLELSARMADRNEVIFSLRAIDSTDQPV
jgi:hypothetical protein